MEHAAENRINLEEEGYVTSGEKAVEKDKT